MEKKSNRITLSDRIAIEAGIFGGHTLKEIATSLYKHPATISREIRKNSTPFCGIKVAGKDCRLATGCKSKHLCSKEGCTRRCVFCIELDCRTLCRRYDNSTCMLLNRPPYVCNTCNRRRSCQIDRVYYSAKNAEALATRRRSNTRMGIHLIGSKLEKLDRLITPLIMKGQPLTHIYAEHQKTLGVSQRTLYNYIDAGVLSIRNMDLRRKVGYRPRKKKNDGTSRMLQQNFRKNRTYEDFQRYMIQNPGMPIVEMDTVRGIRERGNRILTMIFCESNLMLMFLIRDGKAETVVEVFDWLTSLIGIERFRKLFPVILTDNGSEFKYTENMELTVDGQQRTRMFYCDPQASWQKPHIEKNHQYIWYVLPKGQPFNMYTQEDMCVLMNHINSTRRNKLDKASPYELVKSSEMKYLMQQMGLYRVPPDEVQLNKELIKRQKTK